MSLIYLDVNTKGNDSMKRELESGMVESMDLLMINKINNVLCAISMA